MADTFQVEIVTPERKVVDDRATEMQIPGKTGYLGILPGHAPLITELSVGEIGYRDEKGQIKRLAVAWGFAEVLPTKVTILAEVAERAEEIDVARAHLEIGYRDEKGQIKRLAVAWGFAEVLPTKVTILAEVAERAEEIDVARAQRAREAAEAALKNPKSDTDTAAAESEIQRANT